MGGIEVTANNEEEAEELAEAAVIEKFPNKDISFVIVKKLEKVG